MEKGLALCWLWNSISLSFFLSILSNLFKLTLNLSNFLSSSEWLLPLFKVCPDMLARQWSAEETYRINKFAKTTYLCRFTLCNSKWRKMKLLLRQGWKFEYLIQGKWAYQEYKDTWKYKILSLQIFIWLVSAGLEAYSKLELLGKGVACLALMFCNSSAFAISEKKITGIWNISYELYVPSVETGWKTIVINSALVNNS